MTSKVEHVYVCMCVHALHIPKILLPRHSSQTNYPYGNLLISLFLCFQVLFCIVSSLEVRSHSSFLSSSWAYFIFHLSIDWSKAYGSGKWHQLLFFCSHPGSCYSLSVYPSMAIGLFISLAAWTKLLSASSANTQSMMLQIQKVVITETLWLAPRVYASPFYNPPKCHGGYYSRLLSSLEFKGNVA